MSTRLPNGAGVDIPASDEENRKRHEKALRDIDSPDKVERPHHNHVETAGVYRSNCEYCHQLWAALATPQPNGGVEAIFKHYYYPPTDREQDFLREMKAYVAAERTKARVEELENWRVFLGADKYVVAEIDERLAELRGKQTKPEYPDYGGEGYE